MLWFLDMLVIMRYPSGFRASILSIMGSETVGPKAHLQIIMGQSGLKRDTAFSSIGSSFGKRNLHIGWRVIGAAVMV